MANDSRENIDFAALFDIATSRMLSALESYYIWKWMGIAISINNDGGQKRVERNLKIMNRHNPVFHTFLASSYKSFVVDLSIFFDKEGYVESFSPKKLVSALEKKLSQEDIKKLNQEIEKVKSAHGKNIKFLKELRDEGVVHQKINPDFKPKIVEYKKIEDLFDGVQKILNIISRKHDRSMYAWNLIESEVDRQMNWILDNLERGEKVRLEEIHKKWKKEASG